VLPTTPTRSRRRRALRRLLTGVVVVVAVTMHTGPSFAADVPTAPVAPEVPTANIGITSAPMWFPLRGIWLVGCTWNNGCGGHHGRPAIDLATDRFGTGAGAPVYAAGAGQAFITSRGNGCDPDGGTQGNTVEVDHGDGVRSLYTHLQSITVTDGDWVGPDTVIATVGNSGWSSPCTFHHLHFEVTVGGVSIDPGPLWACTDGDLITHPTSGVGSQWATVAQWTPMTNDGTACAVANPRAADAPVSSALIGAVDSVSTSADRMLRISGWLLNSDIPGASLNVAIRWRGPVGGVSGIVAVASTPVMRPDVPAAHPGAPDDAGFELSVTTPSRARSVEVLAVNPATGETTVVARHKIPVHRDESTANSSDGANLWVIAWLSGSL
jgi:hypothetical protein